MARAYNAQELVIAALQGFGDPDLAERSEDCATARRERHHCGANQRPLAQADGSMYSPVRLVSSCISVQVRHITRHAED